MLFQVVIMIDLSQEVLKMEINKLNQFFHEVNVCRLPLNPALVVRGIDADVSPFYSIEYFIFRVMSTRE